MSADKRNEAKTTSDPAVGCSDLLACYHGNHDLISVYRRPVESDAEEIVRWCRTCGSIVIDLDCDGRTAPGEIMRLKSPLIATQPMQANRVDSQNPADKD